MKSGKKMVILAAFRSINLTLNPSADEFKRIGTEQCKNPVDMPAVDSFGAFLWDNSTNSMSSRQT